MYRLRFRVGQVLNNINLNLMSTVPFRIMEPTFPGSIIRPHITMTDPPGQQNASQMQQQEQGWAQQHA